MQLIAKFIFRWRSEKQKHVAQLVIRFMHVCIPRIIIIKTIVIIIIIIIIVVVVVVVVFLLFDVVV